MGVWRFVQDEVLGMRWLDRLIGEGLSALGLDTGGRLGGSLRFFVYDTVKITRLLLRLCAGGHGEGGGGEVRPGR